MTRAFILVVILPLITTSCAFAQRTTRPRRTTNAEKITVKQGDNLQRILNDAEPGDEIVLDARAVFTGNFVLPVKSGNSYITVRSSECDKLPAGERVSPTQSAQMARLETPNTSPVIFAPVRTHHFRFQCLEFTQGSSVREWSYSLITLGEGGSEDKQKSMDTVPHDFEFDRVIVRARDAQTGVQRGMTLNSASTTVTNSYFSDIKMAGTETQALGGWNGPGPFVIENNYLESAGINILFGGAPTAVPNLVPSDITIRRNTLTKRPEWKGRGFAAKNLFELKNARRVTFTDNDCRYSWPEGQTGWAVILNAFRDSPQNQVNDVEIGNNVFRDISNGINIRGMESDDTVTRTHRIRIHDNLFDNMGAYDGEGKVFQVLNGSEDVEIDHNTVRGIVRTALVMQSLETVKHAGLKFTNNLMPHGVYGIFGDGGYFGTAALNKYASNWTVRGNALYSKPQDPAESLYPGGNYFPLSEKKASALMGMDHLPVGVRAPSSSPKSSPPQ